VLIPDSPNNIFKFVRIQELIPVGEPATGASHLCAYGVYDRYGFLSCP
jgi:hypothetical protein